MRAKARVVARGGVIVTVHVFAGTAEVDREDAARRLRHFLATHPGSPRADAARAALARVTR